jgi:hypothetical protein
MPNSANRFVNGAEAALQLDNLAGYLTGRNLAAGQVIVCGYAAAAASNIEPINFSKERALFVINELQRRGVQGELFSEPVGYGSVDLWGTNTSEENRIPNRRVRILIDGSFVTPETIKAAEPVTAIPGAGAAGPAATESPASAQSFKFPWIPLLFLLITAGLAALLFFLSRLTRKRKTEKTTAAPAVQKKAWEPAAVLSVAEQEPPAPAIQEKAWEPAAVLSVTEQEPPAPAIQETAPEPAAVLPVVIAPVLAPAMADIVVNLDEEIRLRAYELFTQAGCRHGYAESDWHTAVTEISAHYGAEGYHVYMADNSWWARRQAPI